jgi:hypothetical protein
VPASQVPASRVPASQVPASRVPEAEVSKAQVTASPIENAVFASKILKELDLPANIQLHFSQYVQNAGGAHSPHATSDATFEAVAGSLDVLSQDFAHLSISAGALVATASVGAAYFRKAPVMHEDAETRVRKTAQCREATVFGLARYPCISPHLSCSTLRLPAADENVKKRRDLEALSTASCEALNDAKGRALPERALELCDRNRYFTPKSQKLCLQRTCAGTLGARLWSAHQKGNPACLTKVVPECTESKFGLLEEVQQACGQTKILQREKGPIVPAYTYEELSRHYASRDDSSWVQGAQLAVTATRKASARLLQNVSAAFRRTGLTDEERLLALTLNATSCSQVITRESITFAAAVFGGDNSRAYLVSPETFSLIQSVLKDITIPLAEALVCWGPVYAWHTNPGGRTCPVPDALLQRLLDALETSLQGIASDHLRDILLSTIHVEKLRGEKLAVRYSNTVRCLCEQLLCWKTITALGGSTLDATTLDFIWVRNGAVLQQVFHEMIGYFYGFPAVLLQDEHPSATSSDSATLILMQSTAATYTYVLGKLCPLLPIIIAATRLAVSNMTGAEAEVIARAVSVYILPLILRVLLLWLRVMNAFSKNLLKVPGNHYYRFMSIVVVPAFDAIRIMLGQLGGITLAASSIGVWNLVLQLFSLEQAQQFSGACTLISIGCVAMSLCTNEAPSKEIQKILKPNTSKLDNIEYAQGILKKLIAV